MELRPSGLGAEPDFVLIAALGEPSGHVADAVTVMHERALRPFTARSRPGPTRNSRRLPSHFPADRWNAGAMSCTVLLGSLGFVGEGE